MLMAAAVLIAMLVTAGAGVMGYSAIRQENPPRGNVQARRLAKRLRPLKLTQGLPPRRRRDETGRGSRSLVIQVEVVDQEGRRLPGADVAVTWIFARGGRPGTESSSRPEPMAPATFSSRCSRTPGCEGPFNLRLGVPTRAGSCDHRRIRSPEKRPLC